MKFLVLSLSVVMVMISCKKETDPSPTPGSREESRLNVSYGADAAQKFDYYLPANRSTANTKVLILVHGGGWSQGDKSDFYPLMDTLKKRLPGYAIFNINYRLSNGSSNLFPSQEMDLKAALTYIFNKRSEYLISEKFVLVGTSAGAHLSLLQAYKYAEPVKIKAVVDFFGPTDLVDMYNNPASILAPPALLSSVIGGTPVTHPLMYSHSSPVTYVTNQAPPTIILHGGLDPVVSPNQSVLLRDLLLSAGVTHEFVLYPGELHGWSGASLVHSFDRIQAFLQANVQ